MIKQSIFCLDLTVQDLRDLTLLKPWEGKMWDDKKNTTVVNFKTIIRPLLEDIQDECAYCGLKLKGTSRGQIEHISPKAQYRTPQFTFTLRNLVLACGYCNGFDKKGTTPTVDILNRLYKKCTFSIVHPYFDDPDDHFDWDDQDVEILISVKDGSSKGLKSIELFGLATPKMSELRAMQVRFEEHKAARPLSLADENLIKRIQENQ